MYPNHLYVALSITISFSNLGLSSKHPPFLSTGWVIEAEIPIFGKWLF